MRFLLKVIMDVEAGNRLAKAGKLGTTMVPGDLAKAASAIEAAVKKYG